MTMIFVKEAAKALPHSERAFQVAKVSGASENYAVSIGYSPERNLRLLFDCPRPFVIGWTKTQTNPRQFAYR